MENWKIIDRFPNYAISNLGNVKNIKFGNFLKGEKLSLCRDGVKNKISRATLLAAFDSFKEDILFEEWVEIKDFPNYDISNFGNVKNKTTGIMLKGNEVKLHKNGVVKSCMRARLVALHFLPLPDDDISNFRVVRKDLNTENHKSNNLVWIDKKKESNPFYRREMGLPW